MRRESPKRYLRKVFSETGLAPGARRAILFSNVEKSLNGFPLHVLGLLITLTIQYDAVAATMPSTMPAWRFYEAIARFRFKIGEHYHIQDFGGARLWHDSLRMAVDQLSDPGSALADADATNGTRSVQLYIPFAVPRPAPGAEWDGSIPVAALRDEDMEFVIASGSTPFGIAGVTLDDVDVDIHADVAALHQVRVPTAWECRTFVESRTEFNHEPAGPMFYLDINDPQLQATPDLSGYGDIQIAIGDGVLDRQSPAELVYAHNLHQRRRGVTTGVALETATAPRFIPLIRSQADDLITRQPMGRVKLKLISRQLAETTLQYRARGSRNGTYRAEMYRRLGVTADGVAEIRTSKGSVPEHLVPFMDEAIRWPGMPFPAIADNAALRT